MEMNAEGYAQQDSFGDHQIIVVNPVTQQLVLAVQDLLGISVSPVNLDLL
jgi:hypothetical protein